MDPGQILAGLRARGYKVQHTYANASSWPPAEIELELPEGGTLSDELRWYLRQNKVAIVSELQRETSEDYDNMVEAAMASAEAALAPGNPDRYGDSDNSCSTTGGDGDDDAGVGIVGIVGISLTCCPESSERLQKREETQETTSGLKPDNPDNPDTPSSSVDWTRDVTELLAEPPACLCRQAEMYRADPERLLRPLVAAVRLCIAESRVPGVSPTTALRSAPDPAAIRPAVVRALEVGRELGGAA